MDDAQLRKLTEKYHYDPSFDKDTSPIVAPMPGIQKFNEACKRPSTGCDSVWLKSSFSWPILTREQERHLFIRLNFRKHQIAKLLDGKSPKRVILAKCKPYTFCIEQDSDTLCRCNMRLIFKYANRCPRLKNEAMEVGQDTLIRSIHRFSPFRPNPNGGYIKFSTYLTWAIRRNLYDFIQTEAVQQRGFMQGTNFDGIVDNYDFVAEQEQQDEEIHAKKQVREMLEELEPRQRRIIVERFGLRSTNKKSLQAVAKKLGITKERVRQIQQRALEKLREHRARHAQ